jgi:hypothetical protein
MDKTECGKIIDLVTTAEEVGIDRNALNGTPNFSTKSK